ncbi:ABC-type Fe(3+)-hydroxamate transport system periplasmic component [Methanonatronarchaeum thermophilum]|uniref:ABC-type Fe(3+)-hydroxamate transport system periplasmic component n=1 Tax=Methanonatronarchaeum thermophilum TaxID=1927129 RepID=A0A1Y3GD94_9EURY|nr:ABC transporter substrate-binding protein [Methanonatronarchaeum thermophilum]OUJ19421.1 ABC-type Fe(3+)-hydroxamate transport system periplasmic component [Methanonatronarchaeum thermophilum]
MNVVSLAPNVSVCLVDLEVDDLVVGCSEFDLDGSLDVGRFLEPDYDLIVDLDPDVVFTSDRLQLDIVEEVEGLGLEVCHFELRRFSDLYDMVEELGCLLGVEGRAISLVDDISGRVGRVRDWVSDLGCPVVYCEEWEDPAVASGNWVPDIVDIAGGEYPFVEPGDRAKVVGLEEFVSFDVDFFFSHVCGVGLRESFSCSREDWGYEGYVYFLNPDLMNQLSTRSIFGIECMAEIMHGYSFQEGCNFNKVWFEEAVCRNSPSM